MAQFPLDQCRIDEKYRDYRADDDRRNEEGDAGEHYPSGSASAPAEGADASQYETDASQQQADRQQQQH